MNLYIVSVDLINGLYPIVLDVLSLIAIFSGVLVITTKNPIVSVLFLISLFLVIAVYLIMVGIHFIGLAYLLVYLGAIAILFLFTIMLMDIRSAELSSYVSNSLPLALFFSLILFYTLSSDNLVECDVDMSSSYNWDGALVGVSHISSIGNIMYTSYSIWLIITGLILLLAMVGAIVISLKSTSNKGTVLNNTNLYSSSDKNTSLTLKRSYCGQAKGKGKNNKNVIDKRRLYSVKVGPSPRCINIPGQENSSISPQYITGFIDAEGCFRVKITKDPKRPSGVRVIPLFTIHLHIREITLLDKIKEYFGGAGSKRVSGGGKTVTYSVSSIKEINDVVIPNFDKYPLITQKRSDYLLFKMIMDLINKGAHLTPEGVTDILRYQGAMNKGLSQILKISFPNVVLAERPLVDDLDFIDPN